MRGRSVTTQLQGRKELLLLLAVLLIAAAAVLLSLRSWLGDERWGDPITTRNLGSRRPPAAVAVPDFSKMWESGGRNPFGDAAVTLESGGKARIPLPPMPTLVPEPPPAPTVEPIDLLVGGAK